MTRCYTELIQLPTFKERYDYLRLGGIVGQDTFGFDRYLNQKFYHSPEWKRIRDKVIIRDEGRDLAMEGYELHGNIFVHHMNPMIPKDLVDDREIRVQMLANSFIDSFQVGVLSVETKALRLCHKLYRKEEFLHGFSE